ncbi:MAG: hypothetical protein E6J90_05710 [Deltaproteobacteria bacterium]|nr:MAG: hypothetical protein E6J91_13070 [Deltaproteobacteria bacterium]TMQ25572.1 MAG: hypothetical protein E6J90_05710 [Deltaproteobacteria bacterium]
MTDRRTFSMIAEPVFADGETPYGPEYWRRDGTDRGSVVKVFRDPVELEGYADLHVAAHLWVHEDFENDAWHVLDVDEPLEIGSDFLVIRRRPGIYLRSLIPELTDAPAPPTERLLLLRSTVDTLVAAAVEPRARFIARWSPIGSGPRART